MAPVDPMSVMVSLEECSYLGAVAETKERTDKDSILKVLTDDGQTADAIKRRAYLLVRAEHALRVYSKSLRLAATVKVSGETLFCGQKLIPQEIIPIVRKRNRGRHF